MEKILDELMILTRTPGPNQTKPNQTTGLIDPTQHKQQYVLLLGYNAYNSYKTHHFETLATREKFCTMCVNYRTNQAMHACMLNTHTAQSVQKIPNCYTACTCFFYWFYSFTVIALQMSWVLAMIFSRIIVDALDLSWRLIKTNRLSICKFRFT